MLQNARATAFTVSELLRENVQGGIPPPQITVKDVTADDVICKARRAYI